MNTIRILPEAIANKIAAGEVIERPASVVKELVENALDAQATAIEVEVAHGGKSLIRVSDNGSGMSPEDASLAFERHATSKIESDRDLEAIRSFGFRGEALPSIAAVSRTRVATGTHSADEATLLQIDGGFAQKPTTASPRSGTQVEIRDLFFNTPARRKFLRTDTTEMGHILDTVNHLALAHPNVRFQLRTPTSIALDLPAVESHLHRAQAVVGQDTAKHLLEFSTQNNEVKIWGVIGKPFVARSNRLGQRFYINQRWIKSIALSYAVQDGYYGLLMHGKYPLSIIFLEVDPKRVDVNVHPTKQEVRLSNEASLKGLLRQAVADRLRKESDLAPYLQRKALKGSPPGISTTAHGPVTPEPSQPQRTFSLNPTGRVYSPQQTQPTLATLDQADILLERFQITRILGQVHRMFILAETKEGFLIIDQHAAHERVMFEALLKNFKAKEPERQSLLVDAVLELPKRQLELLQQALPLLGKLGFEIEAFGKNALVVRAYPSALGQEDPTRFLSNYLDEKESGQLRTELERHTDEIAALIACKRRSVKAHDPLSPEAMRTLLTRIANCDNPFSCPHGRPTFIQQTLSNLEHQFKRK